MEQKKSIEKRRYLRLEIAAKIKVSRKTKALNKSKAISALSKNFSIDGICFTSEKKMEKGTPVNIDIFLELRKKPLRLGGKVVWSSPVRKLGKKNLFDTGVKLFTILKGNENKFVEFVCAKMIQGFSEYLRSK
jgi:Tfp pilus assembly protein PilZ